MFVAKEVEKECEICHKRIKYETIAEPQYSFEPVYYIHDFASEKNVGISILNHFICIECAENLFWKVVKG